MKAKLPARLYISSGSILLATLFSSCGDDSYQRAAAMTGGDPARGETAIRQYGCSACHTIPGIKGANSLVGPPLNSMASRMYIGGVLPNTPENIIRWIQNPRAVDELTAMPNLAVSDSDARDIAGYLYTLR
jgi:cytochrome c2